MADYDAKIRVSADTKQAERSLQDLEAKVNKLASGLDIGKKVGRSFTEAFVPPQQLKQLDRELATIASRADTVAKRFARVVEGVGTIGVAAKGISDVGHTLEQLSVSAQSVAANFNNANAAAKVLIPGFNIAKDSANLLSKSIGTLEYKFHALVPNAQAVVNAISAIGPQAGIASGAIAAIGVAFESVLKGRAKELETEVGTVLKTITDQTQQLLRTLEALNIPLSGTVRQFQNLLRTGEERFANVSSYSDEARRALSTILTAEMRLTAELERQAVLRREMEASRFASVAQRTGMQFTFGGPKALPMAGQTAFQGAMRGGLGGGARSLVPSQTEMLVNAAGGRASRSGIEARATTASLQFGTKLSTEVDKLNALSAAEKARTKEINARLLPAFNEQRVREGTVKILNNEVKLNESNLRIEQALNGERARGVRFLEKQTAEEQRQVQLGILGQKTNRLPGQSGGPGFPSAGPVPLGMYGQGRTQAGGRRGGGFGRAASGALSNAAVGGAFPLLFGQSGSAAAGGALGGIAGSLIPGIGGFGGSLIGTIIGEKAGQGNKVKELAADIGFSAEQTKMLGTAFRQAGQDFDKFQQSVSTIQGLSLSIDDQARAIELASSLTETYKGKIDKVTNAFAGALSSGKVTQGTINQLTNQGIPIQQALAEKYNVSRSAIIQMAKDGKISVQDLIDTLVKVGNEGAKAAGTQKDVFADSFEQISKAVTDFQTTASQAFKQTGDALRVDLGGAIQAVTTYITDLIGGFGELARVAGPVLDPIISGYINLEKAIFNAVGAVPALRDAVVQFVLTVAGPLAGVVTLMNQIRGLGAAAKKSEKPEKYGPYVPDRLKKKPLESFIAPAQAVAASKDTGADKTAKAAEREAERVANIVRDRAAATEQLRLQMQYAHGIFVAEVAKNPLLKLELEFQQQIGEISVDYSKQINDEKAKGNSAAAKAAITAHSLVKTEVAQLDYAMKRKKLEFERKENYDNLLMDLDQEVKLRSATTEEARNQLRIAYEMAKLEQTKMYSSDQLAAIQNRKQQIAAPKTPYETVSLAAGGITDELTKLLDTGNQVVTIADAIGNSFSNSFKGVISGSMTAREALAGFFQSVADAFLDMAAQIISKWIQMTILNSVLSLFPGGGGLAKSGGAGFDMGPLNNVGMSTFNPANSFPGLATGGPAMANTPYIVGEKGPELFMPGRSGTVIPNDALGGGGSTNVVVNVDASGNSNVQGDQAQAKQLGVVVSAAVQAELVKQQRPGGLLAGTRR
jgi:tape measure domain-containing protein